MYEFNRIVVINIISPFCLWPARERGIKTKTNESIAGDSWVEVGSARER